MLWACRKLEWDEGVGVGGRGGVAGLMPVTYLHHVHGLDGAEEGSEAQQALLRQVGQVVSFSCTPRNQTP